MGVQLPPGSDLRNQLVGGGLGGFFRGTNPGLVTISGGLDQSRVVGVAGALNTGQVPTGIDVRSQAAPAVLQSDLLPLNLTTAAPKYVVYLGLLSRILDMSSTPLPPGDIQMIDPNGVDHDLAVWTVTKTMGDWQVPSFPPGLYTFTNLSGGNLTGLAIYAIHTGARNLA